jgi:probable rRNA maturation factor
LSFAPADIALPRRVPKQWGDLIVSSDFVRRDADRRGIAFREELLRVTIHGMLHLFGYDHATRADEKRMFGLQERIVQEVM